MPRVLSILAAAGFEVEAVITEEPDHATDLAARAGEQGHEVVFACGGDGTQREVATGLLGSPVALAVLPAGTTNVLARALGLPIRLLDASHSYAGPCTTQEIDVGLCAGRPFLMMASAGIDARTLLNTKPSMKERWGRAAIVVQGLRTLRTYSFPPMHVRAGDSEGSASYVAANNIRLYGGPFEIAPQAKLDDGLLDVLLFHSTGARKTLGLVWDVARGKHPLRNDVSMWQAKSLRIESDADLDIQIDGDPLRLPSPVDIQIADQRLRVLLPEPRV